MLIHRRQLLHAIVKMMDLLMMVAAMALTTWFLAREQFGLDFGELLRMRVKVGNFVLFLLLLAAWHLTFRAFGLYRSLRLASRWSEARDVLKATSVGSLLLLNIGLLFDVSLFTPQFVATFWLLSTCLILIVRLLARAQLERARMLGRNLRDVLIVGTNRRARRFAARLVERRQLGYRVMGFVDDEWSGIEMIEGVGEVVANLDELPEYLRTHVVDEVVLTLPIASHYGHCSRVLRLCEAQGIKVRFLSDFFEMNMARATVELFDNEPVLLVQTGPTDVWPMVVKQMLDFVLSALLVILLSPLLLAIAALIKLTSPGPVFFAQERVGLSKRRFDMMKFRTMVQDAEKKLAEIEHLNEVSGPVFKIRNDPRITAIGQFLRRTSLDELPQLFSVLKGDMSLVGPRPLPVRDYEGFDQDWHRRRFSVRPGVTCLWQVEGRSSIPFERWMELDMQYIDQWSLWLDFKILMQTIPAVLRGVGAS